MKLFHSTSKYHLLEILKSGLGLYKGDVPITPLGGFNAVWLSDRESPKNSWMHACAVNKSEVIIEVDIDPKDTMLKKWTSVMAEHRMHKKWADALNKDNDWMHWYIYQGAIRDWQAMTIDGNRYTRGDHEWV